MKKLEVNKGQVIQRKGDLKSKVYIVESGLLRSYSVDKKGKEYIFMFAPEGWVIADNCPPEEPCDLYIDAIEDAVIYQREKELSAEVDVARLVKRLSVLQKRVTMLMSSPALDRYEHFIMTYPDIAKRVPQRMIASYLGITPQALSAIRKEITKK